MKETPPAISRVRTAGPRRKPKPGRTREQTLFAQKLRRETTRTEKRLWPRLRDSQLGAPFRRQHVIGKDFVDYCCIPLRLVVEVDGPLHDLRRDAARDAPPAKTTAVIPEARSAVRDLLLCLSVRLGRSRPSASLRPG